MTDGLERISGRATQVGLVSGGLAAYWPQFPDLLPELQGMAGRIAERLRALGDLLGIETVEVRT